MFRTLSCIALLLGGAPLTAGAAATDPATLDRLVAEFTGVGVGQPGGAREPVDRRLRLRACAAQPEAAWHGSPGRTVVVQCPEPGGWRIFVNLAPQSGSATPHARPAAAVRRGDNLTVTVIGRGFAIRRPAEALEAGAVGDWISVRTAADREPLRVRIVQPGLAEIALH